MKELLSEVVKSIKTIALTMYKEVAYFMRSYKNQD